MRGLITMSALLGNSHDLQFKMWYISATLFLYKKSFEVLRKELKVAPDTKLGVKK
jgi:hypothetical protein